MTEAEYLRAFAEVNEKADRRVATIEAWRADSIEALKKVWALLHEEEPYPGEAEPIPPPRVVSEARREHLPPVQGPQPQVVAKPARPSGRAKRPASGNGGARSERKTAIATLPKAERRAALRRWVGEEVRAGVVVTPGYVKVRLGDVNPPNEASFVASTLAFLAEHGILEVKTPGKPGTATVYVRTEKPHEALAPG